jgi:hypothetical protein
MMTPIDGVVACFCFSLSFAVARSTGLGLEHALTRSVQRVADCVARPLAAAFGDLTAFYAWFKDSGLEMAKYRGYGQAACKMYGIIPSPKLSVFSMRVAGLAFLALLLAAATPLTPAAAWRAPMLGAALVPYHLYFSQLYCEAHVGAHVTVLVPPALLLLALSPSLDPQLASKADAASLSVDASRTSAACAAFTCWMMKIVLTSAYAGAGVCKISKSLRSLAKGGNSWWSGSTLQAFIFEAMFLSNPSTHSSFGMPTPFSYMLQRLHVRTLRIPAAARKRCTPASCLRAALCTLQNATPLISPCALAPRHAYARAVA